jgi:hypothetical protein
MRLKKGVFLPVTLIFNFKDNTHLKDAERIFHKKQIFQKIKLKLYALGDMRYCCSDSSFWRWPFTFRHCFDFCFLHKTF